MFIVTICTQSYKMNRMNFLIYYIRLNIVFPVGKKTQYSDTVYTTYAQRMGNPGIYCSHIL